LCTATLVIAIFFVFQPFGLNQFGLPKFLILLLSLPMLTVLELRALLVHTYRSADQVSARLALVFLFSSTLLPLTHATNTSLHGLGAIGALAMFLLFRAAMALESPASRNTLLSIVCLAVIPLAILALLQGVGADPLQHLFNLHSSRPGRWHMLSTLGHPTWTAELLVLLLPPILALLRSKPRVARIAALLISCTVILSGSRGSMLVLGILLWICIRSHLFSLSEGHSKKTELCITIGLMAAALILLLRVDPQRLFSWTPLTGRLGLWAAGLDLIEIHPLTGSGLHHTALLLPEGLRSVVALSRQSWVQGLPTVLVNRLDNDILQISVERGLPSLVLLFWFFQRSFRNLRHRVLEKAEPGDNALRASLIGICLFCLFSSPLHTPATTVVFWLFAGLSAAGQCKETSRPTQYSPSRFGKLVLPASALLLSIWLLIRIVLPALSANSTAGSAHQLLHQGHFEKTAEVLAPITIRSPWLPEAGIDRARALVKLHRPEEALAELNRAGRWTASAWIWRTRALALDQLGLKNEARMIIRSGLEVLPRSKLLLRTKAESVEGNK